MVSIIRKRSSSYSPARAKCVRAGAPRNRHPFCRACVLTLGLSLLAAWLCGAGGPPDASRSAAPPSPQPPRKLLFVGDSFTFCNGGLDTHVAQLANAASPPRSIAADRATKGGSPLRKLHGLPWVHDKIRDGGYDVVILQEDIPEYREHSPAPFFEYGRLFDREIRNAGGKTVLLMAWPYERLNWVSQSEIAKAHRDLGSELKAPVAPVGLAFQRALTERPTMAMLGRDKEHETTHGTYLAASVVYATLFDESPEGFKYYPAGVSAEEAAFLQRIAWQTVQAWRTSEGRATQGHTTATEGQTTEGQALRKSS